MCNYMLTFNLRGVLIKSLAFCFCFCAFVKVDCFLVPVDDLRTHLGIHELITLWLILTS